MTNSNANGVKMKKIRAALILLSVTTDPEPGGQFRFLAPVPSILSRIFFPSHPSSMFDVIIIVALHWPPFQECASLLNTIVFNQFIQYIPSLSLLHSPIKSFLFVVFSNYSHRNSLLLFTRWDSLEIEWEEMDVNKSIQPFGFYRRLKFWGWQREKWAKTNIFWGWGPAWLLVVALFGLGLLPNSLFILDAICVNNINFGAKFPLLPNSKYSFIFTYIFPFLAPPIYCAHKMPSHFHCFGNSFIRHMKKEKPSTLFDLKGTLLWSQIQFQNNHPFFSSFNWPQNWF